MALPRRCAHLHRGGNDAGLLAQLPDRHVDVGLVGLDPTAGNSHHSPRSGQSAHECGTRAPGNRCRAQQTNDFPLDNRQVVGQLPTLRVHVRTDSPTRPPCHRPESGGIGREPTDRPRGAERGRVGLGDRTGRARTAEWKAVRCPGGPMCAYWRTHGLKQPIGGAGSGRSHQCRCGRVVAALSRRAAR